MNNASRVTQKSLFTVTNVLFYFFHAIWCHDHTIPLKQLSSADFAIVAKDSIFWFSVVTSYSSIVHETVLYISNYLWEKSIDFVYVK